MEESGGVDEIEGVPLERRSKHVACDDPDRGGEVGLPEEILPLLDELGVRFEGDEGARSADTLAESFEPEWRGASCIQDGETLDVAE